MAKGMILAAGQGTRVRPLTKDLPKPMVPILGRPVMEYLIEHLARHGIKEIMVNVAYHHQRIEDYFGDGSRWGGVEGRCPSLSLRLSDCPVFKKSFVMSIRWCGQHSNLLYQLIEGLQATARARISSSTCTISVTLPGRNKVSGLLLAHVSER